jgi:hypothetical protein
MRNRQEWEDRGQQVVREMMAAIGINREWLGTPEKPTPRQIRD